MFSRVTRHSVISGGQLEICYGAQSSESYLFGNKSGTCQEHPHLATPKEASRDDGGGWGSWCSPHKSRNIQVTSQVRATGDVRNADEAGTSMKSTEIFLFFPGQNQNLALILPYAIAISSNIVSYWKSKAWFFKSQDCACKCDGLRFFLFLFYRS